MQSFRRAAALASLTLAALGAASAASAADIYADGGLRSIKGLPTQAEARIGVDTELSRSSGLRVGLEASQALGEREYHQISGVVSYDAGELTPYVKFGKLGGDVAGRYTGLGIEYRTSPRPEGWALTAEAGRVKFSDSDDHARSITVGARYRF